MFRFRSGALAAIAFWGLSAPVVAADYRVDINGFVESDDWVGLRSYLAQRPELTNGDSFDAKALRVFQEQTAGLYAALTFENDAFPKLTPVSTLALAKRPVARNSSITDIVDVSKQAGEIETPKLLSKKKAALPKVKKRAKKPKAQKLVARKAIKSAPEVKKKASRKHESFATQEEVEGSKLPLIVASQLTKNGTQKIKKSTLRLYERITSGGDY